MSNLFKDLSIGEKQAIMDIQCDYVDLNTHNLDYQVGRLILEAETLLHDIKGYKKDYPLRII